MAGFLSSDCGEIQTNYQGGNNKNKVITNLIEDIEINFHQFGISVSGNSQD